MKRVSKIIRIAILVGIVGYIAYFFIDFEIFGHSLIWHTKAKEYYWLLTKSTQAKIDTFSSLSYVQRHDVYNSYGLKDGEQRYAIVIWEFKDMKHADLNDISIQQKVRFQHVKFDRGETLDPDSSPAITIEYGFDFNDGMEVQFNRASQIDTVFGGRNYKAFYGSVHKMLLRNDIGKRMILFDYTNELQYSLFVLYKKKDRFFLLSVNADDPFNPMQLIKVFNLPQLRVSNDTENYQ